MRVVVTGATGLIGRHAVAALLDRGHDVVCVARHAGPVADGTTSVSLDLLDPSSVDALAALEADVLLHLAWETRHGQFWGDPSNVEWLAASARLGAAVLAAGTRRIVLAGTCADAFEPRPLYAVCKQACTDVLTALARDQDAEVAEGRVHFLYGAGEDDRRFVSHLVRSLVHGDQFAMSSGTQVRDFLDARDVGAAFAAIVASAATGTIDIGTGAGVSLADVAALAEHVVGTSGLVRVGALDDRVGEPSSVVADVRRLQEDVGFVPGRALADGLADLAAWWRARA